MAGHAGAYAPRDFCVAGHAGAYAAAGPCDFHVADHAGAYAAAGPCDFRVADDAGAYADALADSGYVGVQCDYGLTGCLIGHALALYGCYDV